MLKKGSPATYQAYHREVTCPFRIKLLQPCSLRTSAPRLSFAMRSHNVSKVISRIVKDLASFLWLAPKGAKFNFKFCPSPVPLILHSLGNNPGCPQLSKVWESILSPYPHATEWYFLISI